MTTAAKPVALAFALVVTLSMTLMAGGSANASLLNKSQAEASVAPKAVVAHNSLGKMTTRIVGETANGRTVTGKFTPLHFTRDNGKLRVQGLVSGVVHNGNGTTSTFATLKTIRVKSINGVPAHARPTTQARATCDILHLVLAPLDLNLLGLVVHLDRVVLDIVAVSGAGNLLGNLLCAVTGLLDGGLGGLLGRITDLLNQILGALRLGV